MVRRDVVEVVEVNRVRRDVEEVEEFNMLRRDVEFNRVR